MKPTTNLVYWKPGQYVPAAATDVAATFKRVRKQMKDAEQDAEQIERARVEQEQREKVAPIRRAKC